MRELARRLQAIPLVEDAPDGFLIERARESSVEAAFYRRVTTSSASVDPFGREERQRSFSYSLCRFLASDETLGLELVDAPRGSQSFVSRLLEICDFQLTILPLQVNVDDWANRIVTDLRVQAHVDVVQAGNIDLGGGSIARVTIRGVHDVRQTASDFVSRPYSVEKIQVRFYESYAGTSIVLTHAGSARIQGPSEVEVREAARRSLLALLDES